MRHRHRHGHYGLQRSHIALHTHPPIHALRRMHRRVLLLLVFVVAAIVRRAALRNVCSVSVRRILRTAYHCTHFATKRSVLGRPRRILHLLAFLFCVSLLFVFGVVVDVHARIDIAHRTWYTAHHSHYSRHCHRMHQTHIRTVRTTVRTVHTIAMIGHGHERVHHLHLSHLSQSHPTPQRHADTSAQSSVSSFSSSLSFSSSSMRAQFDESGRYPPPPSSPLSVHVFDAELTALTAAPTTLPIPRPRRPTHREAKDPPRTVPVVPSALAIPPRCRRRHIPAVAVAAESTPSTYVDVVASASHCLGRDIDRTQNIAATHNLNRCAAHSMSSVHNHTPCHRLRPRPWPYASSMSHHRYVRQIRRPQLSRDT